MALKSPLKPAYGVYPLILNKYCFKNFKRHLLLLHTMAQKHPCYPNVGCYADLSLSPPEFVPYVFQVMSLLLEIHSNSIPSSYMALFPHLLQPTLWERTGNIPPLVRLLQAYLEKGGATIASNAADKIVSQALS